MSRSVSARPPLRAAGPSPPPLDLAVLEDRTLYSATPLGDDAVAAAPPHPDAPTITPLDDLAIQEDGFLGSHSFQLDDADTPLDQLQVSVESSNLELIPLENILLEGHGDQRSLTLAPLANASGEADITLRVSDGQHTTTESFHVTVAPVNDAPTTTGIADVVIDGPQRTAVIDLFSAFHDVEDADDQLSYAVHANSNPELFERLEINQQQGTLTIQFASQAAGVAELTITATDRGGLTVSLDTQQRDVTVFDQIHVNGLDTSGLGLSPLNLWGGWYMFENVNGEYQFDELREEWYRSLLRRPEVAQPEIPTVLNLENEYYVNTPMGRDRFAEVLHITHEESPDQQVGIYRILPERSWYDPVSWRLSQQHQALGLDTWHTANAQDFQDRYEQWKERSELYRTQTVSDEYGGGTVAEKVDFVNPSLYTVFQDDHTANLMNWLEVSIDADSNTITVDGPAFDKVGKVWLRAAHDGHLPSGVSQDMSYHVVNAEGNTFQISATKGGAAIDLDASFSGKIYTSPMGPWDDPWLDPNVVNWRIYAEENIAEARKFGKPVYAWITPSLQAVGQTYLDKEFFRYQLDLLAELADGIVVYEEPIHSAAFHQNQGWWEALNEFMDDHRIAQPTFTVTVSASEVSLPTPQEAHDDNFTMDEDGSLLGAPSGLLGNDVGWTEDSRVQLVQAPQHGALVLQGDGSFVYTPDANFHGQDSFQYRLWDGSTWSNAATAQVQINPVNDAPTTVDDHYLLASIGSLTHAAPGLLSNDHDADNDSLAAQVFEGPQHGKLTLHANGSFSYQPDAGFAGTDSFQYLATDSSGATQVGTVTLTVVPEPQVAQDDSFSVSEDESLYGTPGGLLGNDQGWTSDSQVQLVQGPEHGTVTLQEDGSFVYSPVANYNGSDSFQYRLWDGSSWSNTATATIEIIPVNDAPTAADDHYTVPSSGGLTQATPGVLSNDSDLDGDVLSAVLHEAPRHGQLTLRADGSFVYKANDGFSGTDGFQYAATDANGGLHIGRVTFTVLAQEPSDPDPVDPDPVDPDPDDPTPEEPVTTPGRFETLPGQIRKILEEDSGQQLGNFWNTVRSTGTDTLATSSVSPPPTDNRTSLVEPIWTTRSPSYNVGARDSAMRPAGELVEVNLSRPLFSVPDLSPRGNVAVAARHMIYFGSQWWAVSEEDSVAAGLEG